MTEYIVRASALNGTQDYELEIVTDSETSARRAARQVFTDYVREEFNGSPEGVAYLADTRTMTVSAK
jgi:hypothetical protein